MTSGVAGAAAVITVLTLLARAAGFLRWFALNAWVGPNTVGSAYQTANTVPNVLFEVAAGGALAGAVVPLLAAPIAARLRGDVDRIASALLGWTLAVLIPVAALTWLAAPLLVDALLTSAAEPGQAALAVTLLRVFAVQIPLYGLGVVASGVLQAHRRFVAPALAPLLSSIVVMASYYLFALLTPQGVDAQGLSPAAVAALGWGTTAGVVALSVPLLIPLHRAGVRLRPTLRFPDGVARRARSLALAGAAGLIAQQASVIVTVRLANAYGGSGALNVHTYANAVVLLPYAVLAIPLATAMFPRLAEHAATGRYDLVAARTAASTRAIVVVSACGTAALVAAAVPVERVFATFARDGGVAGMAGGVAAGGLGVIGLALMYHLARVLFALERPRPAMLGTSVGWIAVALVAWILAVTTVPDGSDTPAVLRVLGTATSAGSLLGAAMLASAVRRELGPAALSGLARTGGVALVGAGVGAVAGLGVVGLAPAGSGSAGSVVGAVAVGLLAGAVAAGLTLAAVVVADRSTWRAVRSRGAVPRGAPAGGEVRQSTPEPAPAPARAPAPPPAPALAPPPAPEPTPAPDREGRDP